MLATVIAARQTTGLPLTPVSYVALQLVAGDESRLPAESRVSSSADDEATSVGAAVPTSPSSTATRIHFVSSSRNWSPVAASARCRRRALAASVATAAIADLCGDVVAVERGARRQVVDSDECDQCASGGCTGGDGAERRRFTARL